jgi:uncharacterized surface protein with fasciclin (FAS1) repeats
MKPSAKTPGRTRSGNGEATSATPRRTRPDDRANESPYAESLLERFARHPRLQAFNSAVGTAGLTTLLRGDGPLTIFAPTDRAFERIPADRLKALLGDSNRLAELIRHHVVAGRVKAPRAAKPRTVTPEFGETLELTASDRGFHVDEARIVKTNIRATNGVIHAIDRVLDPRLLDG